MTIRALDYPSSSELYIEDEEDELTAHILNFKNNRIGTTAVIDTPRMPVHFSHFYTEHIIEVREGVKGYGRKLTKIFALASNRWQVH